MTARNQKSDEYFIETAPYYEAVGQEISVFKAICYLCLDEGASTRLLVHAGKLIAAGVDPVMACHCSIAQALTDDREMLSAINELAASLF